jgi:hypothetical protein
METVASQLCMNNKKHQNPLPALTTVMQASSQLPLRLLKSPMLRVGERLRDGLTDRLIVFVPGLQNLGNKMGLEIECGRKCSVHIDHSLMSWRAEPLRIGSRVGTSAYGHG